MGYKILKIDGKENIRDAVIEKYNIDKEAVDDFCHSIPLYTKGTHNLGETPDNSFYSKKVLELLNTYFPELK